MFVDDLERERTAMTLLGDVLIELSRRDSVRRIFRDLAGSAKTGLVQGIADDFERAVNERFPAPAGSSGSPPAPEPTPRGGDHTVSDFSSVSSDERARPAVEQAPPAAPEHPAAPEPPAEHPPPEKPAGEEDRSVEEAGAGQGAENSEEFEGPVPFGHPHETRITVDLAESDYVYVHGVSAIPLEERPAVHPFVLQEKGIDGREFAFALDRGGLRFYCSKMAGRAANVSKAGMLLLGKQESLHLRGAHEAIVNELRQHGVLLPFVFGTVARGREDLFDKIDAQLYDLRDAVDEQMATTWWNLSAFMLDAKLAQMLGDEPSTATRSRERPRAASSVPGPAPRIGIKTLERILGKQKKIAESIHEDLKKYAQRTDVDTIVGFNSGTSDEWKLILKSSYEVRPSGIQAFNRAITTLQYRHFLFELMLSLEGDREPFSFQRQ